jgi:hypothetical protein
VKLQLINAQTSVDRVATPEEIRAAVLPYSYPSGEYGAEMLCEIAADVGGYIRIPEVEAETSRLIEELNREQVIGAN